MDAWPDRVEAVFVDVGGVLFVPDSAAVAEALRGSGVDLDEAVVARAHYRAQGEADATGDPRRYAQAYVAALHERDGVAATSAAAALGQACLDLLFVNGKPAHPWGLERSAAAALALLGGRRWRLGIVSNSSGDLAERLSAAGVCQRGDGQGVPVDVIVDSGVVGIAKPDPGIFHVAIGALGVAPSRSLHIGDSVLLDVEPARAAGLVPVHYDPFGVCPAPLDHLHVRSLREVAARAGAVGP